MMKLSIAIDGFLLTKRVAGASPYTIRNYTLTLTRFQTYFDGTDPDLSAITAADVRAFLDQLMTTRFASRGVAPKPAYTLGPKTLRNIHTCLSSLWTWATAEGYADCHIVRAVDAPQPEQPTIQPLTQHQVQDLLKALSYSIPWRTKPETRNQIPRQRRLRDRAIILFLLDTGVRAGELCRLAIADIDLAAGTARVTGKGRMSTGQAKARIVHFGNRTRKALWQYLAEREALHEPDQRLFATRAGDPLIPRTLTTHLRRLGQRAGISGVHPHKFRHTFAINYLRNGGDVYTLQQLLGHTSLEMVRRYLAIAQADIEAAHRRASPVENWKL